MKSFNKKIRKQQSKVINIKRPSNHTKHTVELIDKKKNIGDKLTDTDWAQIEGSESHQNIRDNMHDIASVWSFGRGTRTRKKIDVDFDAMYDFAGYFDTNYKHVFDPLFRDSFESVFT